ncbi:Serine/threonine-protein kinase [Actinidia chinensis var. chinensis]|uniref:Serine/threonine-protein kinase n=1 Tax=Actinidia chinensis var. chinensis TaxID=1590841 RepID=A0A2R6RCZ5_ACTCC|nr:Serine/threonine-protein kinase [Actinidia chinensis var. chinensis]
MVVWTMASLTPGVLSKLLENVGNRDAKVAGDHRTALLQVIGIVPALSGGDSDPWRSKGFFLRVSDSVHSAYVSIADEDADLILSDKIQLGQFVHVARLDSASPVPVLVGVKPVPRRRPCVGEPKDLISSDSLPIPDRVNSAAKKGPRIVKREGVTKSEVKLVAKAKEREKRLAGEELKLRRISTENGRVEGLDLRRLSLDSARRGWDRSIGSKNSPRPGSHSRSKETLNSSDTASEVHSSRRASSGKGSATKCPNLSISPLKSKNENVSHNLVSRPLGKDLKSSSDATLPSHLSKVPLSFKTWADRKVSWELLPHTIHDLGKESVDHRDLAFLAAVNALEEASAAECVIQCMSMFAELCHSSKNDSPGQLVEQFLNLHEAMQKAAAVVDALISTRLQKPKMSPCSQRSLPEFSENLPNKNAISWVLAAVETNLSKFSLFRKEEKRETLNGEKCHLLVLENSPKKIELDNHSPQCKRSPNNHRNSLSESRAKAPFPTRRTISVTKGRETGSEWSKGRGLKDAATLSQKLLSESRAWFLNYLGDSLKNGFGLRVGEASSETASLLRQLKRVNKWLDDSVVDGVGTDERIEGLRKKLYRFLLEHVDSTVR